MSAVRDVINVLGQLASHWRQTSIDLAKIEASIYYIKGIRAARVVILGIVALIAAIVIFLTGWILLNVLVIFLIPWSPNARLAVAVLLALINVGVPAGTAA